MSIAPARTSHDPFTTITAAERHTELRPWDGDTKTPIERLMAGIERGPDRSWMVDAACRGMDPAIFHSERGSDVRRAIKICAGCTVVDECRAYGEAVGSINFGIWGGEFPSRRFRVLDRLEAAGKPTTCKTAGCPGSVAYSRRELCHSCYKGERNARRGESTHTCGICTREFLSLQALSTHLSRTHGLGREERVAAVVVIDRNQEAS